jgi:ribosomal-protein-alanine N-acetyltransferase
MNIRKMNIEDIGAVIRIDQTSFSMPWPESSFITEFTNPNARCWVGVDDTNVVIAFVVIWMVLDEAHIATIAVDESHRKKGHSKTIIKTALQSAYLEGARISYLEVRESNQIAINLYLSLGFELVGVRKAYYKNNNENGILMTLTDFGIINQ